MSFLDMVSGQLANMSEEIIDLKNLVTTLLSIHAPLQRDTTYEIYPPPAPPPLDKYDRAFLLRFCDKGLDVPGTHLPKSLSISALPTRVDAVPEERHTTFAFNASAKDFMPLIASVDYDSLYFYLEEDDLDRHTSLHRDAETNVNRNTSSCFTLEQKELEQYMDDRSKDLNIAEAQHTARSIRFRENWATNRIQSFWRSCKTNINWRSPSRRNKEFISNFDEDFLAGKNSSVKFDELWQAELKAERTANNLWSLEESSRIETPDVPGYMKHRSTHWRDRAPIVFTDLNKHMPRYLDEIFLMARDVPKEKQACFIFKATRGLCERNDIPHGMFQETIDCLESFLETNLMDVLPYICQDCSEAYEAMQHTCSKCGSHGVFDGRAYIHH